MLEDRSERGMKGSEEGTCWVLMKQNPLGPEMRSSKTETLVKLLHWNNSDPYWSDSLKWIHTASVYLFAISVVSFLLRCEIHEVDQTVGGRLAQYEWRLLIICEWTQTEPKHHLMSFNHPLPGKIWQSSFNYMQHCSIVVSLTLVPVTRLGHQRGAIGRRSLRPSCDQHNPADGERCACSGRQYTPYWKRWGGRGRGRGLFYGWLTAAARLREPISDTSLPLPAAETPCLWCIYLFPAPCGGQQHLWQTIMFGQTHTHT